MQIDIISGFFGVGKTTFINRYLSCLNSKVIVIENEFGTKGIDAALIKDNQVEIKEINAGCICCNLALDLSKTINDIIKDNEVKHIIIEPSGISKLSLIIDSCLKLNDVTKVKLNLNHQIVLVDASSFSDSREDFGLFYEDQISNASLIFLNRYESLNDTYLTKVISEIKNLNQQAIIIKEDIFKLSNEELLTIINKTSTSKPNKASVNEDNKQLSLSTKTILINRDFNIEDMGALEKLLKEESFNNIIRAKGILNSDQLNSKWHFDYTKGYFDYRLVVNKLNEELSRIIIIGDNLSEQQFALLKEK